ncbi:HNH endonuclease [Aminipila butyrica]|uniref:HNH endonuclease n=1 Tax=Aminipila butyrica TaxID=433296 RepID=A0A858BSQ3_9FIRM|nr:HNH endonuclease [Aminipila butyrica]QIB68607.1 HNH endonuclease [Aminipila butyrica]
MALKKTCTCGKLIDYSAPYCDECQARRKQEQAAKHRRYDKHIRNKEAAAFYNSPQWKHVRAEVIRNYKGLDFYEYYINKQIVYADMVHHIVELSEDWERRLDPRNLIPLAQEGQGNHSMIHKLYLKDKIKAQKLLFSLLNQWQLEFGGGGGT